MTKCSRFHIICVSDKKKWLTGFCVKIVCPELTLTFARLQPVPFNATAPPLLYAYYKSLEKFLRRCKSFPKLFQSWTENCQQKLCTANIFNSFTQILSHRSRFVDQIDCPCMPPQLIVRWLQVVFSQNYVCPHLFGSSLLVHIMILTYIDVEQYSRLSVSYGTFWNVLCFLMPFEKP